MVAWAGVMGGRRASQAVPLLRGSRPPSWGNLPPLQRGHAPASGEAPPALGGCSPRPGECPPALGELAPRLGGSSPALGEAPSKAFPPAFFSLGKGPRIDGVLAPITSAPNSADTFKGAHFYLSISVVWRFRVILSFRCPTISPCSKPIQPPRRVVVV